MRGTSKEHLVFWSVVHRAPPSVLARQRPAQPIWQERIRAAHCLRPSTSDPRIPALAGLRSLRQRGFAYFRQLHNNSFKPTPLRGAA